MHAVSKLNAIKKKKKKMKKDIQSTNVMRSTLANTIRLDNTQTHTGMQASHQIRIKKWWKEALVSGYGIWN